MSTNFKKRGFTNSNDGIERKTFSIKIRLTEDLVRELMPIVDASEFNEKGLRDFLRDLMIQGINTATDSDSL